MSCVSIKAQEYKRAHKSRCKKMVKIIQKVQQATPDGHPIFPLRSDALVKRSLFLAGFFPVRSSAEIAYTYLDLLNEKAAYMNNFHVVANTKSEDSADKLRAAPCFQEIICNRMQPVKESYEGVFTLLENAETQQSLDHLPAYSEVVLAQLRKSHEHFIEFLYQVAKTTEFHHDTYTVIQNIAEELLINKETQPEMRTTQALFAQIQIIKIKQDINAYTIIIQLLKEVGTFLDASKTFYRICDNSLSHLTKLYQTLGVTEQKINHKSIQFQQQFSKFVEGLRIKLYREYRSFNRFFQKPEHGSAEEIETVVKYYAKLRSAAELVNHFREDHEYKDLVHANLKSSMLQLGTSVTLLMKTFADQIAKATIQLGKEKKELSETDDESPDPDTDEK